MGLVRNTFSGLRHKHWTKMEVITYFLKGVARELKIAPSFFLSLHIKSNNRAFKKWRVKTDAGHEYLDINGIKILNICRNNFDEILSVFCYHNDNYDKHIVEYVDKHTFEGPYCYKDGDFDVTVKEGDVVMDVGASIGEFCAYAAYKGALSYAFEPVDDRYQELCETASLNDGRIIPVKLGLSSIEGEVLISKGDISPSLVFCGSEKEKIILTTLDKFVEENNLTKVDFIKSDIEGAERDLLRGATEVLRKYAPKLSICTYHLPDDPEVLEKIIMEANPNYTVIHLRHKLMAAVV